MKEWPSWSVQGNGIKLAFKFISDPFVLNFSFIEEYMINKIKSTMSFIVAPRKMEHLGKNRTGVWFVCLKLLNDHKSGFNVQ